MTGPNIIRTGRILNWFVTDLKALRKRPDVTIHVKLGVWCRTEPGLGRPWLWRFPQPVHPVEAIAAIRGFGGPESEYCTPRLREYRLMTIGEARKTPWVDYTEYLSQFLFVTPATTRLVWHLLTPMPVPRGWAAVGDIQQALWFAATGAGRPALPRPDDELAERARARFWTHEVTGDIEL